MLDTESSDTIRPSDSYGSTTEKALSLARSLSDARQVRRKEEISRRSGPLNRSQFRANQRALENLVASYLVRTGFEVEKFAELQEQRLAEFDRFLEEHLNEAVRDSAQANTTLRRSISQFYEALDLLAEPSTFLLDKPILIWQTQGIDFPETQVEAGNSTALSMHCPDSCQHFHSAICFSMQTSTFSIRRSPLGSSQIALQKKRNRTPARST